ncbi:MAG TPA: ATP-binding protein [Opitutaceae bacterium]|nr:ATP-binding protein [Opitutaceae bacterium]
MAKQLPVEPLPAVETQPADLSASAPSGWLGNRRVLVVDDNVSIHEDFKKILVPDTRKQAELDAFEQAVFGRTSMKRAASDFVVECAQQGEDGFKMVKRAKEEGKPYALAFVDMRMPPGWNGLETVVKMWEVDPELQIAICTACSDYSWDEIVSRVGVSDRLVILKKPFDQIEVLQLGHALTEKWRLMQRINHRVDDLESLVQQRTEELYKNHERLQLIARASNDAIWDWNVSTGEVWWNEGFEMLFGHPPEEMQSGTEVWTLWVHPEDLARVDAGMRSTILGRASFWSEEYRFKRRDGGYALVSARGYVVRDVSGAAVRMIGALQDITQRKEAEKERHLLEVQLRQAQKLESIGQLAGGVAHEINTPMQYIGDNARFVRDAFSDLKVLFETTDRLLEAARRGVVEPEIIREMEFARRSTDFDFLMSEIPHALDQAIDGVERVTTIVRAMKEFSHPGTEGKTLVDLNKAIESTLTVCRNEWKYVAEVLTEFDASLPLVPVLPGEFNQVILNLVINAAHAISEKGGKAEGKKGLITVSTRTEGEWIEISIRDTGTGIPPNVRDRIFDPFFTTKEVGKGTGQGLAISRAVVTAKHGGSLTFVTEIGVGTCFTVRLPKVDLSSRATSEEKSNVEHVSFA